MALSARDRLGGYEILEALKRVEGNEDKDDAELIREGIYQLFLKYADDKDTRELIFEKIRSYQITDPSPTLYKERGSYA